VIDTQAEQEARGVVVVFVDFNRYGRGIGQINIAAESNGGFASADRRTFAGLGKVGTDTQFVTVADRPARAT
jgi:hypothetical protein